jgi:hypothetical protein
MTYRNSYPDEDYIISDRVGNAKIIMLYCPDEKQGFERFFQLLGEFQQLGSQEIHADGIEDEEVITFGFPYDCEYQHFCTKLKATEDRKSLCQLTWQDGSTVYIIPHSLEKRYTFYPLTPIPNPHFSQFCCNLVKDEACCPEIVSDS